MPHTPDFIVYADFFQTNSVALEDQLVVSVSLPQL